MRFFLVFSVFLATLPVLGLNLSPKQGEEVLAIFKANTDEALLMKLAHENRLDVVSYDGELRHLIVQDHDGKSTKALYGIGASLVVDADFLSLCNPDGRTTRSL